MAGIVRHLREIAAAAILIRESERNDVGGLLMSVGIYRSLFMSSDTTPLSKNASKKAVKAARLAALKLERRAREKEAKKEKKRIRAEKRAAGELVDDGEEEIKRRMKRPKLQFGGTVVVDLGFDSMMNDKVSSITPSYNLPWNVIFS